MFIDGNNQSVVTYSFRCFFFPTSSCVLSIRVVMKTDNKAFFIEWYHRERSRTTTGLASLFLPNDSFPTTVCWFWPSYRCKNKCPRSRHGCKQFHVNEADVWKAVFAGPPKERAENTRRQRSKTTLPRLRPYHWKSLPEKKTNKRNCATRWKNIQRKLVVEPYGSCNNIRRLINWRRCD